MIDMATLTESFGSLAGKFKLDQHHGIERVGVCFITLMVSFVGIFGGAAWKASSIYKDSLGSTPVYTSDFVTSKTDLKGTVEGVFTDERKTKAMVLMKFSDTEKMSNDAKMFQAFVSGATPEGSRKSLKGRPSGSIYVFGTTGYVGLYMVDSSTFDSQVMHVIMRSNAEITPTEPLTDSEREKMDASFEKYDQWSVLVNPGASGTNHAKALDDSTPDLKSLYNEMVVVPQEKELKSKLDADLVTMRSNLMAIQEYRKSLTRIKMPDTKVGVDPKSITVPSQIAGDQIIGRPADPVKNTPSSLRLKSRTVAPGGFEFDWRDKSVMDGYLKDLVPDNESMVEFLDRKRQAEDSRLDVSSISPVLTDGSLLGDQDSTVGPVKEMNRYLSLLTNAYSEYYASKRNYQVTDLGELLELDMSLQDVETNHSVNSSDIALQIF